MTVLRRITVNAPAKLNLCLDVTGEDGWGYHLLDGVMLAVDLCDTVTLTLGEEEGIAVSCDWAGVPTGGENLAVRAAEAFFAALRAAGRGTLIPAGLHIDIAKRIPMQAGLAGGSADAAAVLRGLNALLRAGLGREALAELGLSLGSDVPFCLAGGCARARGRGELLEPLPVPEQAVFVVAKPLCGGDTREVFARYDRCPGPLARPDVNAMAACLGVGDYPGVGRAMGNVFEQVTASGEVACLIRGMKDAGALGAAMTGTGTATAGLFAREADALRCLERLRAGPVPLELCAVARPCYPSDDSSLIGN